MNTTPNYGLGQPEATDEFKDFRQLFNDNMDIIDLNMGGNGGFFAVVAGELCQVYDDGN